MSLLPYKALATLQRARQIELNEYRNARVIERREGLRLAANRERLARWESSTSRYCERAIETAKRIASRRTV